MRRSVVAMLTGVPLLFGVIALFLGNDSNWDLRNYHWYNAYAILHGRLDMDMGVAQTPSFYNPTLDIPFYLAASVLPAKIYAFLLGTVQGCNFILLYLIAMRTLTLESRGRKIAVSAAVAFVGMVGAGQFAQLAAAFYDNIVSLFVLGAVAIVLHNKELLQRGSIPRALACSAVAGALVGLGVGLKLPTQIFAVGACFGLLFVPGPFVRRFFLSFVCGLGIIAGFAVSGGWWMWDLWTRYANPLFPYFNDLFQSPWGLPAHYRDDRFVPKDITEALTLPFRMFVDAKVVGEIPFRDGRVLVAYVVLAATAIMLVLKHLEKTRTTTPAFADAFAVRYLAAASVLSYIAWLGLFGIYRYMLPLEMLAPLVVVGCFAFWPVSRTRQVSLAVGALGFMVITMQPGTWGRKPWGPGFGGKLVDVTAPAIADPAHTLIVMTGFAPTAFVIPAFPPEIPFVRIHSYLTDSQSPTMFNKTMHARIAAHGGDLLLLRATWESWTDKDVLPLYGLRVAPDSCRPIRANLDDDIELCGLDRVAAAGPESQPPQP